MSTEQFQEGSGKAHKVGIAGLPAHDVTEPRIESSEDHVDQNKVVECAGLMTATSSGAKERATLLVPSETDGSSKIVTVEDAVVEGSPAETERISMLEKQVATLTHQMNVLTKENLRHRTDMWNEVHSIRIHFGKLIAAFDGKIEKLKTLTDRKINGVLEKCVDKTCPVSLVP